MKKLVLIVNIILFAFIATFLIINVEHNKSAYAKAGSEEQIQKIKENLVETSENILPNLMFNGEALPLDTGSSTFYLPLTMKTEDWEFGKLSSGEEGVSILFEDNLEGVNKLDAIATNQSFHFLAYTGSTYKEYQLLFTGLPMMNITINEGNLEDSAQIDMSLFSANTKSEWVKHSMGNISIRGNTSKWYPKQAYKLELTKFDKAGNTVNNDIALLDMRKDNDWVLYAMYNDNTKVRDKLSIDIWNSFGATDNPFSCNFGTKLEYVELVVNGEYHGIYGLMEPVDAKKLDITKASEEESQEYIYKRTTPVGLVLEDFNEDSDTITRSGFELKGISKYGTVTLKSWEPLKRFIEIQNLENDEEYKKSISQVVDVNSAANAWLFLQIVSGSDNIGKNMYYVSKMTSSGSRFYFIPWDLDLTWGNVSKTAEECPGLFTAFEPQILEDRVNWDPGDRVVLLNVDNCILSVKEKWKTLRSSILTNESLTNQIVALEHTVVDSGAMARETKRWPDGAHTTNYDDLIQYATDKMNYLDTYFATLGEE